MVEVVNWTTDEDPDPVTDVPMIEEAEFPGAVPAG